MENNNLEKEYWGKSFYGSKLNTVLLLILIVLMIFALRFMYQNQGEYLPSLSNDTIENTEQKETDVNKNIVCENEFCFDDLPPSRIYNIKSDTYENIGITKNELAKLATARFGDCNLDASCSDRNIEIAQADIKIFGDELSKGVPIAIITQGPNNDSVSVERLIVKLYKNASGDDLWRLSQAYKTWSCFPGRGHQDFSAELCY